LKIPSPDLDHEIVPGRSEVVAAGGEGDGPDGCSVRGEGVYAGPFIVVRVGCKEFDRVVVGGGSEKLTGSEKLAKRERCGTGETHLFGWVPGDRLDVLTVLH
jgi:hypothetical protein